MLPERNYTDDEIKKRVVQFIKDGRKGMDNDTEDKLFHRLRNYR